ncbi:MAG: serine protease [Proteobacteria bacterium]|nr:serine protease [Pseudomonadota bacterium]
MFLRKKLLCLFFLLPFLFLNEAHAMDPKQIYKTVSESVFLVVSPKFIGNSNTVGNVTQGSAVAIAPNILATNCHVALSGNLVLARKNQKLFKLQLVYQDPQHDLCLLGTKDGNFKPVKIKPSAEVDIGEEVYAIGNPEGLEKTISRGLLSNKDNAILQTDASTSPGSSGGGLFDSDGNLIGITTGKVRGENIGFAIPSEWVIQALKSVDLTKITWEKAPEVQIQAKSQNPLEKIITNSPVLKTFGDNGITLYKNQNQCLVFIPGRDQENQIVSYAVWFPKNPNTIMFLPTSKTIQEGLQIFQAFLAIPNKIFGISFSYILINNQLANLYRAQWVDPNKMLFSFSNQNISGVLTRVNGFAVQYRDLYSASGYRQVQFGLSGMNAAVAASQTDCKN